MSCQKKKKKKRKTPTDLPKIICESALYTK